MKRISIVTLMAALVLLSGCNKDNEFSVDIDINNSSEVPIKLGTHTGAPSVTRASIESLDEMIGTDDRLGVFCLAGRKTDVKSAQNAKDINWLQPVYTDDKPDYVDKYGSSTNGRYWSNLCCEVRVIDGMHHIVPVKEGAEHYKPYYKYYPITSVYGYDFYSYYPYQNDADVHYTRDSIYVDMSLTGKEDIIFGKSEEIDTCVTKLTSDYDLQKILTASYYSARFFRKHPQKKDNAHIKLEHKLARLRFFVYPGPDHEANGEKDFTGTENLCVKGIKINNVKTDLRLVVAANGSRKGRTGALYATQNSKEEDLYLFHKDGGLLEDEPVEISTEVINGEIVPDTTQVGDCIMLLPGRSVYYMSVQLADENTGYVYPSETDIAISFKNNAKKSFEAGKTYNVYLQVSGIKEIGITAELADWEESGEDMDIVEFN